MAEFSSVDVQRFEQKDYDVTCCCETLFCGFSKLELGPDEAEMKTSSCAGLCVDSKRGPYGELGTVDTNTCCCFTGFRANSLMMPEATQCIGCGCDSTLVDEIVAELKKRQAMRGDRAKTRMGEKTIVELALLQKKIDLVMEKLDIPPITADEMER